jgi:hypothetical protein
VFSVESAVAAAPHSSEGQMQVGHLDHSIVDDVCAGIRSSLDEFGVVTIFTEMVDD